MQRNYDHVFKVILVGSTFAGKTAILRRFADNEYNESYISTIGIDFRFKSFYHQEKYIKLQIWDTAGQQRFKNITRSYYNGSHAIVLVFDIHDQKSFQDLKDKWIVDALSHCNPNQIYCFANKADDPYSSNLKEEVRTFCQLNGIRLFEVSAKTGRNVDRAFMEITQNLMEQYPPQKNSLMKLQIEEFHTEREKKKSCDC